MTSPKPHFTTNYEETNFNEFETRDFEPQQKNGTARLVESIRLGLTLVVLLVAITIVGTTGDSLMVFNTTTLDKEFNLSLWPTDFDLRPTIALIAAGSVVVLASALSLAVSKFPSTRRHYLIHSSISLLSPAICLIAGLVGTSVYYGVNTSNSVYTLQSWTCQWSTISMDVKPHWGTLCKQSKVALYLTILLIPLELLVIAAAARGAFAEKKQPIVHERKGSPSLSQ